MKITVNIKNDLFKNKGIQEFVEFDLGQITTTLQDLLDNASITIVNDTIPVLSITNIDNSVSKYLLKSVTQDIFNNTEFITGYELDINDLILIGGTGIVGGIQNIIAGTNVTVDNSDLLNPIVSASTDGRKIVEAVFYIPSFFDNTITDNSTVNLITGSYTTYIRNDFGNLTLTKNSLSSFDLISTEGFSNLSSFATIFTSVTSNNYIFKYIFQSPNVIRFTLCDRSTNLPITVPITNPAERFSLRVTTKL
jgi:hypothetical protein